MTTILCVRHAAHDNVGGFLAGRTPGIRLGPAGRAQAERLAKRLRHEPLDAVITSPRERTRETAAAICAGRRLDAQIDGELDEIDFGTWSNRAFEDLNADESWRRWNAVRWLSATPAGDTMLKTQARMVSVVERIRSVLPEGRVALVSHADPIKSLLSHFLGLPLDAISRFDISPASVSRIEIGPWTSVVRSVNEPTGREEDEP